MLLIQTFSSLLSNGPEREDAELLHHVEFSSLVKVEDVREEAGIPVKIKLLLLHVVVVTHLQHKQDNK